jgi:hypothetical protein
LVLLELMASTGVLEDIMLEETPVPMGTLDGAE